MATSSMSSENTHLVFLCHETFCKMPLTMVTDDFSTKPFDFMPLDENPSMLTPNTQKVQWQLTEQTGPAHTRIILQAPEMV